MGRRTPAARTAPKARSRDAGAGPNSLRPGGQPGPAPGWRSGLGSPQQQALPPVQRPVRAGYALPAAKPAVRSGCASPRLPCCATNVPHWGGSPRWELPSATRSSCHRHQSRRACRRYQPCNSRLPCECSHSGSLPTPQIISSGSGIRCGQRLPRRSLTQLAGNVTSQSFGSQHRRLGCAPVCERSMYHIFDAECQTHLAGIE